MRLYVMQRVRESECILERKYPNFDINDKYCIVGGCDNEPSSSSWGAFSSSSGSWWGGDDRSKECPINTSRLGGSYIVDNKVVYAYGNDAYNASGQYLGSTDKVIFSKIPQVLAKRDKTKTYNYFGGENIEEELFEGSYFLAKQLQPITGPDGRQIINGCGEYGYIEYIDGKKLYVGGITCPYAEASYDIFTTEGKKTSIETKNNAKECAGGKLKWLDNMVLKIFPDKVNPSIHIIYVGFKYSDGYRATQADINNIRKHEQGHEKDIKCTFDKIKEEGKKGRDVPLPNGYICECDLKELANKEARKDVNTYNIKFQEDGKKYHDKYGHTGYPQENYVCPK
jgi:hypothetical protein